MDERGEALRALRATAVTIANERNATALCSARPPFGLLDQGAVTLSGRKNVSRLAACVSLAEQFTKTRSRLQHHTPTSCAVVGSGGILRFSGNGANIDQHASILRFNGAPTLSMYHRDVGSRTTMQLSTLVPWRHWRRRVDAEKLARTRDNVLYCHNHWVGNCWLDALNHGDGRVVNPVLVRRMGKLLLLHHGSQKRREASSRASSRVPSTGLLGVAIALATCNSAPSVFGFGNRSDEAICDHYWECRTDQRSYLGRPTHSFRAQWSLLSWLHDVGAIRLHAEAPSKAFTMPADRPRANV